MTLSRHHERRFSALRPETVVSCHYTYKGIGFPLGVMHRYAAYAHCISGLIARFGEARDGAHLVALPVDAVYGLVTLVMGPLSAGATLVIPRRFDPKSMIELLSQHQIRLACLVPALFPAMIVAKRSLAQKGRLAPFHPGLVFTSGGSYLTPKLGLEMGEAFGVEPWQGYGATETLPVTTNHANASRRGSLGLPLLSETRISIVDAEGEPLPVGRIGQIVISGPTVMAGYWRRPRETHRFLRAGEFHTGDLGHLDGDGFLHFNGRALPFAKRSARMVDLVEIEEHLRRHPRISDARVTVEASSQGGERLVASLVVRERAALTQSEVVAYCKHYFSSHKVPQRVRFFERNMVAVARAPQQEPE